MKKFIIINGEHAYLKNFSDSECTVAEKKALEWAENYCDHSHEIIVRQVNFIKDLDNGTTYNHYNKSEL